MTTHRFKAGNSTKFGRCSKQERQACTTCDEDGKRACVRLKKLYITAIPEGRSPVKEPGTRGDNRNYTIVPHQGQRVYLGPTFSGVMETYQYLVSWVKAGVNGSFLVHERTASQHARARNISKKQWLEHIKLLRDMLLIDTIPRRHVASGDTGDAQAYIVLPHPDWLVDLAEVQFQLGRRNWNEVGKITALESRQTEIIASVKAIVADGRAARRRARFHAVDSGSQTSRAPGAIAANKKRVERTGR